MLKRSVSRLDHTSFGLPCDLTVAANLCVGRGGERKGGGGSCGLLSRRVQQQQQQQHASVLKERSWVCSKLCLGIPRRDFRTMLSENSSNPAGIEEENNNKADAASQVGIIKEVELDVTSSSMLQEMQQQQQQQLLINSHESQEHMKQTAAELTEDLTRAEMLEHLQFIKRLPHKLLRDIGFIIAGPSLLSNSVELPVVSADLVGGSHSQWASTKVWLKSLRVSDVEAWFSSHRPSTRLGDHFALCVEYVLRFSPLINVHQLLTSQQVLQTVTKTSQDQGLLLEREELLQVCSSSDGGLVVPTADTRSSCPIVPVLEATLSSSAAASERVNSRLEPTDKPTELLGKRKRKLLRKLERLRLGKGITTTIGEFDFLFQARAARAAPAAQDSAAALSNNHNSAAHDLEVQHWEVSVKYLLYAGPWEVFGMTTPDHAAWSCKDAKESDKEHGYSILSKTGNSNNANKEGNDAAAMKVVTTLRGRALDYVKDADEFLGCFLGPHVGETLLDRKSRLCNQLALSSNPCAAVMLWNLYGKAAGAEIRSSDSNIEAETVEEYGADDSNMMTLTSEAADLQEQFAEMEQVVKVIPRALLKGYLFYEYKLWHYLNSQQYYHTASHNSAEHNGCSNNSTWIAKDQSETENTVQELHSSGENNNNNDVTAIRNDKNQKQTSASDGEKLPAKSSLNMKHWMGWWTQDLTEFAYLPHHCGSMWYIVPKLEWLSPVVIPSSDKERCAQILSVEAFLVVAAGVQAEAGRLCMPKKSRFLVAELCWETSWKHEQVLKVEEETQAANVMYSTTQDATTEYSTTQQKSSGGIQGAWIETSRGFIVENTWPISKLYKPHGYVVSWSPSLQQVGQLNSSDP